MISTKTSEQMDAELSAQIQATVNPEFPVLETESQTLTTEEI